MAEPLPMEFICAGAWHHPVTVHKTRDGFKVPKRCPSCGSKLERYDGRKHRAWDEERERKAHPKRKAPVS